jgi:peptide/nickel transport system ATP-binding protein
VNETMSANPTMRVFNLTVMYGKGAAAVRALNNVSLTIPGPGFSLGLVGESGSGKTTLAYSMMNLIRPPGYIQSGQIEYEGKNILEFSKDELRKFRWKEIAMIYQSAMNSLNPVKPIQQPIMEVIRQHTGGSKEEARKKAISLLSEVGIDARVGNIFPFQLSGGMRQRVVIALALALSPKILIADEPTSGLDVVLQRQILKLLKKQVEKGRSLIFVTHEIALLADLVDYVAVMHNGKIVEFGEMDKVLFEPKDEYTKKLLGSVSGLETRRTFETQTVRNN